MGIVAPVPTWWFQGDIDDNPAPFVTDVAIAALRDSGATNTNLTKYTVYTNTAHQTWTKAYAEPNFFPFILAQNKTKIYVMGNNPICCGVGTDLAFSKGFYQYQWFKDGVAIPGANKHKLTNITEAGSYYVQYVKRGSDVVLTSQPVTLSDGSTNTPPSVSLASPLNGASYTAPASITLAATASDLEGTIAKVDFYQGTTLLYSDVSAPYSYNWTGVAAGPYNFSAVATDNLGTSTTSSTVSLVVGSNPAPVVSLTSPANNAKYTAPATISLTATATDANGSIAKVDFYRGTTLLYSDASSPYSYNWSGVAAGTYSITAVATDNLGASTTSTAASIVVSGNTPPVVSLTSPANNSTYTSPASITITASASDVGGSISKVEFYRGSTLLATDASSPYSYSWTGVAAGTYSITAKATDNTSLTTTSSAVTVIVGNAPPTVSITSPANNASFTFPASITINATAADANGTVSRVEFYSGNTKLGEDLSSPYSYTWSNAAVGTYTVTAKATDNGNAATTSSAVTIVVKAPTATEFCFEAEAGLGQNAFAPFRVMSDAKASGGKYIVVPNGTGNQSAPPSNSIATFSFYVPATATYYFWLRVIAPTSNDNSILIRTDSKSYVAWTPGTFTSWTWKKWTSSSLSAGNHSISIARNEDGLQIDKIIVTKSSGTPSGLGCGVSARMDEFAEMEEEMDGMATSSLVAPNPSSESFFITTTDQAITRLTVNSTWGVEVYSAHDIAKGTRTAIGSDWESGMYTIRVQYENGKAETLKVIKVK